MARILVAVFGFCLLVLGAGPAAHAAKRVAFVVGIDSYDNLPQQLQLKKAVNDAKAVSEALDEPSAYEPVVPGATLNEAAARSLG